jgi:hypothetical protein
MHRVQPREGRRIRVDVRPQRECREQREHAAADADPECQRHDDGGRQDRAAREAAPREAHVLREVVQEPKAASLAAVVLPRNRIAEFQPGAAPRVLGRKALRHQVRGPCLEVEAQLVFHAALERRSMAQRAPEGPCTRPVPHLHHSYLSALSGSVAVARRAGM